MTTPTRATAAARPATVPPRWPFAWYDWTFGAGVVSIVGGVALWSVPLACIVAGALVCGVSFIGAVTDHRRHKTPDVANPDAT